MKGTMTGIFLTTEAAMRTFLLLFTLGCLLMAVGCTTTSTGEKPKILCPACGTELDAIMHTHF